MHCISVQWARGNTLVHLPYVEENSRVVKGKACSPELKWFWARVYSLSWIHIATISLSISCWWSVFKGCYLLVVWTSYVLLIPEMEKKDISCQIRLPSKEYKFAVSFKSSKFPAPAYCSERMRQHIGLWAIITGKLEVQNMQWLLSWAQMHWRCCIFIVWVYLLNQDTSNSFVAEFV